MRCSVVKSSELRTVFLFARSFPKLTKMLRSLEFDFPVDRTADSATRGVERMQVIVLAIKRKAEKEGWLLQWFNLLTHSLTYWCGLGGWRAG